MPRLLVLNHVLLLLFCSIYLGTGVSLVFFQFPLEPKLTVDNYYLMFVEPVTNATRFFTYMTILMLVTGVIMLITEWFSGLRWVPVVVLLGVRAHVASITCRRLLNGPGSGYASCKRTGVRLRL